MHALNSQKTSTILTLNHQKVRSSIYTYNSKFIYAEWSQNYKTQARNKAQKNNIYVIMVYENLSMLFI